MSSKNHARADSVMTNLWWRPRADGVEVAYFRKWIGGKDVWQVIGIVPADDARRLCKEKLEKHGLEGLMRALGENAEAPANARTAPSTGSPRLLRKRRPFWMPANNQPPGSI